MPHATDTIDDSTLAFAALAPQDVLNAVESLGFACDGRLLALNSYENRVYQVGVDDASPVIAKFYRPGRWSDEAVLEEHDFTRELAELGIPVVAPLAVDGETLHFRGPFRLSVAPNRPGRAPELDDHGLLEQLGRLVARLHLHGETEAFECRPALDVESFGTASAEFLLDSGFLPDELRDVYASLADHLLEAIERCTGHAGATRQIRTHGDFHPGNVLVAGEAVHIVDMDDARTAPAVQDLWMLLSGDRQEQEAQLATILAGYEQFRRFDARELHLVEALRTLRIMHYAAWLGRRWDDPAFRQAFPWFDTRRYWDEHVLALREQLALMQEPPLAWYA
ncbi:MAG: serine/threonine protein kinase [Woeseiaceae bacterium]|nr:serine/threonine protein kinase [Woeseiaceae bacterium]